MRCKIVRATYVAQYYEVNQKLKKFRFYIIVLIQAIAWHSNSLGRVLNGMPQINFEATNIIIYTTPWTKIESIH